MTVNFKSFLLAFFMGFSAGWLTNGWRADARVNAIYAAHERLQNAAQEAIVAALANAREAEAAGEAQAQRQIALEAKTRKLTKEKEDAIRKLAGNRLCFDAPTLRLLNDSRAPGLRDPGLPTPARGALGPDAAAAADSGESASDADVALWAVHAREQYDACRGRIDALNHFFGETP